MDNLPNDELASNTQTQGTAPVAPPLSRSEFINIMFVTLMVVVALSLYFVDSMPSKNGANMTAPQFTNEFKVILPPVTSSIPEENAQVSQSATPTYVSNDYKFSFAYPETWHLGGDDLGVNGGVLQLFNFDREQSTGLEGAWATGHNNIQVVVLNNFNNHFTDGITTEVVVAGQWAFFNQGEEVKYNSYVIPLPSQPGKHLQVTIYGDPENYFILDELLKTMTWL